jgi:hypothetical protein
MPADPRNLPTQEEFAIIMRMVWDEGKPTEEVRAWYLANHKRPPGTFDYYHPSPL